MNIDNFFNVIKQGECPICGDKNFVTVKNNNGTTFKKCQTCNAIPAFCHGTIYAFKGWNPSFSDCELCGASPADADNHALAY